MNTILITGGNVKVGAALIERLSNYTILSPHSRELDCLNKDDLLRYVHTHTPDVILHAAAFTDVSAAEKERGEKSGRCYRVNVDGTQHIVDAAKAIGAYMIYMSTGSVFSGTAENPGPFNEDQPHMMEDELSWYAYTKALAEDRVFGNGAILRISHPIGYIEPMLQLYDKGELFPLFTDQLFPITDIDAMALCINALISKNRIGIYHEVSRDVVSPFELISYCVKHFNKIGPHISTMQFSDFIKTATNPKRYAQFCAIDGAFTHKTLQLPDYSWKDAVHLSSKIV